MLVAQLDYDFDREQIAQFPLPQRDDSKLMLVDRRSRSITHESFSQLPHLLEPGDLVVLNDAKVFPARLRGRRATGGSVEVLLTEKMPGPGDRWLCLTGRADRVRMGEEVDFSGGLRGVWGARAEDGRRIVAFGGRRDVWSAILEVGQMPLPPYIRRTPAAQDGERYQTVYARADGSIAAPTAGLHFTDRTLDELRAAGVGVAYLSLTVGLGTFLPIRAPELELHRMRAEKYFIPAATAEAIKRTKDGGGRVVAVGTTTTRALEGAACGYGRVGPGEGWTDIFIVPGYEFGVVDCLLTNFHLPRSTPLALAMALGGVELVRTSYRAAVDEKYRLYSYGDAMLIR